MDLENIASLKQEIRCLEEELLSKRKLLTELEEKVNTTSINTKYSESFDKDEITRYSRQMLIPGISVHGQKKLKQSKVLIIGAGGLGCPSSLYLAAAGIGHITIIDDDEVELSNLHRQVLHHNFDIGRPKVTSAFNKLSQINNKITILPIQTHIDSKTINNVLNERKYDVAIDATDNVATRYLINDACVLNGIPLVSGSALQLEGQLTVYNYNEGPCYRCLYPKPPPPEAVTSCGDGGVLGAVPGVIGVLQALETIKIIIGDAYKNSRTLSGRILTFDGSDTTFRQIKVTNKNPKCEICSSNPVITSLIDYEQFCQAKSHDKVVNINILKDDEKIQPKDLFNKPNKQIVIDVRPEVEFKICHIPNTINLPYSKIASLSSSRELKDLFKKIINIGKEQQVYVLCRRGNDSQRAIAVLKKAFIESQIKFINVSGGLHAFAKQVDDNFPVY